MNYGGSYGGSYGGMLNDAHPKYSKKRRGFGSRIASSHGIVAWLLFLATLIYTIKTRSALTKELAELKQFSSSTESETFDKMSKMTQQIADKNREIGDLNKTQRSNQKRITGLESEKTALQANIQAAKDETARCTQREASLQTQLSDCESNCAREIDSHGEAHKSKDAEIEELKRQVQRLIEKGQPSPQARDTPTPVPAPPVPVPSPKNNANNAQKQQKDQRQAQQDQPPTPGQMDNVQYETPPEARESRPTKQEKEESKSRVTVTPLPHPSDPPKRRKKKRAPSKLEQDIGIDSVDAEEGDPYGYM